MTRRAHKTDANQQAIVKALRDAGCRVLVTSHFGDGFPDLVVLLRRQFYLVEVKAHKGAPLTKHEAELHLFFAEGPIYVVTSAADALAKLGLSEYRT